MAHDIFICHAPEDRRTADSVRAALEADGLKCWLAPRDTEAVKSRAKSVVRAIDECRVFILVVSRSAVKSVAVTGEAARAFAKGRPVVYAYAEEVAADVMNSLGRARYAVDLWPETAAGLPLLLRRVRDLVSEQPPASAGSHLLAGGRRGARADADRATDEYLDALRASFRREGVGGRSEPQRPSGGAGADDPIERMLREVRRAPAPQPAPPPPAPASPKASRPAAAGPAKVEDAQAEARMKEAAASQRRPEKVGAGRAAERGWVRRCLGRVFGPKTDSVDCSVFAPPSVARGENFLVQVFAHCPEQAAEAHSLAREFDADAERRGYRSLEAEIARGAKITFHLVIPGVEVSLPVQQLIWQGRPQSVQFGARVPKDTKFGDIIGTVLLSVADVPAGHIKFKLTIKAKHKSGATRKAKPAGAAARAYRKAFVSYAAQDRAEVLKRVQMLSKLRIEFFQDLLDLEPGARWERELYRHIDESDLFLLFWSGAAKQSEWVLNEVRYALARKRDDDTQPPEIIPVIIEGPPPAAPPPELAHLHFNDYLVYFMAPPAA